MKGIISLSIDVHVWAQYREKYKGVASKRIESFLKQELDIVSENPDLVSEDKVKKELSKVNEEQAVLLNKKQALNYKLELLAKEKEEKVKEEKQKQDDYKAYLNEFESLAPQEKMDWKIKAERAGYEDHARFYAEHIAKLLKGE